MTRKDEHKIKMGVKRNMRERMHRMFSGPQHIAANLSRNHPDYGMSMEEHMAAKASRK